MYTLECVSSDANFITANEEFQFDRDSHFFLFLVFLFPKATF